MARLFDKFLKIWYFRFNNPVVRKGETEAFRWKFRRFWLEIETKSGNWKARWTASEYPYGYLLSGKTDDNIEGFAATMYQVGALLTTDQAFVNEIQKALKKYNTRLEKQAKVEEDETEEKIALEEVRQLQEYSELPKRYRKRKDRETDKRFREAVKKAGKDE